MPDAGKSWLRGAVGYEIYARSFADSTGNGFGDLQGITSHLDYLAWLGVDIVWLTPIYPSPDHDHGYDVADYRNVRSEHGSIADVEALVERAHELDMKFIMDIVPNHTSSDHRWFQAALADPSSPERDMYLFKDPGPDGGPPNNWISHFGGPAWTLDEASGQYYCHLFVSEQPDLDWRNERVLQEFDDIYRFWFERGVDGFRIDVAHGLLKHPSFADNPMKHPIRDGAGPLERFFSFDHKYDMDQDGNVEIFQRWQRVAAEFDACLLAESGVTDFERLARYVGPGALDLTFFLKPGWMGWEPANLMSEHLGLAAVESDGVSWVISNHDNPRPVSRFTKHDGGSEAVGGARSLAVTTLQFALGGVPFLYYGEELGLADGQVDESKREDPVATRNDEHGGEARDVARTPMPWDSSAFNGFSSVQPWIFSEQRAPHEAVEGQKADPNAPVHRYRALLAVRRSYPDLYAAAYEPLAVESDEVAAIRRGTTCTIANLGASPATVELPAGDWALVFASSDAGAVIADGRITLDAELSVILSL